ncbi:threalose-6-phosphate phosphatase [Ophidiomyces ophidiicola]|uniref:Threalose-6-phosphate phosphatase n=1 Tax=Ophidiomyces ophidiicola TaxID=1387563 RepID=A0ACB8UX56_9EURO|nr:threalose-6-phosphate phosphatase [Ophidiomyces ophidiicola]KAI1911462.1 threalose-6-phosphate phosphatase [Ophidiomyces ophidiicola]KAI1913787.1 threalose-6-phosphate phosphatase [Ophidiomyces ophidiicola]KAI1926282.1 threalose-6-phosphate phosphatase [Ophidiomyces ophidiicola]KAI1943366.1 threalose-6-phosphate phosphatase [Ophidiomyces ophidiicola]KAI1953010.1 threalose-6-phosphate phosphatase [Ophidiomyces ophidiicola]
MASSSTVFPPDPPSIRLKEPASNGDYSANHKNPPPLLSELKTLDTAAPEPPVVEDGPLGNSPGNPAEAAKGAQSGRELLRRLSLVGNKPMPSIMTSPEEHADLNLTGRIISAAFCIPYKVRYGSGLDWELQNRPGTSALFDHFQYLASTANSWSHTLVGWTGEVEKSTQQLSYFQPRGIPNSDAESPQFRTTLMPLNKASAPIPVDANRKSVPPAADGIKITKDARDRLEEQLSSSKYGKILPVWLCDNSEPPDQTLLLRDQTRWRRYAEREIYSLFHYKQHGPNDGRAERRWWQDYRRMNQLFADRILEEYQPGDIVWIHDYHLLLLPSLLRQRNPEIYIGFFLHIPFPSSEFFRCLTRRKEILTGVLGSNMVGFQSFTYSRHFSSCCTRILRFESNSAGIDAYGAHVAVDVFPIGIDVEAVRKLAYGEPSTERTIAEIKKLYAGKKIIIGRDRLDSVRGVTQKLMAFEMFLERYPQWRDKVVLIQVTSPTSLEEEKEEPETKLSSQMSHLVATINGKYGSLSFSPVQHYPQYLPRHEYFALLRAADVGLITSVRDGMNTTSLEYILCQQENHGPLILSEFSGTAGTLHNAIHINPWDSGGVAAAIHEALTMSPEKKLEQHEPLYKHVITNTVSRWSDHYVWRLLTNLSSFNQSIATPVLDKVKLLEQYRKARSRLFMFDYDGTLTPIVKDPQAAIPSDRVVRTLKTLAADPKNSVWIISGRDQNFLEEWMGHISELGLSAEHGCFIRKPHNDTWENLTDKSNMGWQKEVVDVFQYYTERTQGSFIERKRVALTWHYRRVDPEYGAYQAKECRRHLESTVAKKWDVEIMAGKANLEVRPTFVNKGEIASRLVNECDGQPEFVLCLGDDFTDEDMFRALRRSNLPPDRVFSVTVGASSKQTEASWHLLEPSNVIATISLLNSCDD